MPPGGLEPPTARSSAGRSPAELRRRARVVIIYGGGLRFNAGGVVVAIAVLIQPISWFSQELLWRIEEILTNMFDGVSFCISSDILSPPLTAFDWHRKQYYSPMLLEYIFEKVKDVIGKRNYVICIGDVDAYSDSLNFVFGEAVPDLNIACVYTRRLNPYYYNMDVRTDYYRLFITRIIKEIIHEWGHLLGLPHCTNKRCVMSFSNSVIDVDEKTPFFCDKCRKILLKQYNIRQRNVMVPNETNLYIDDEGSTP